jgi:hypothetical protein
MSISSAHEKALEDILLRWKTAVDARQTADVGALFTTDAIFQGLHPYGVGPADVAEYYESQPLGMVANYTIVETRAPAEDVILGYMRVEFTFPDRPPVNVYLSLLLKQVGGDWQISLYQVSKLD